MANRDKHIDDFLENKFKGFESLPDDAAWDAIAREIEHLSNPVDQSLNHHLSGMEDAPSPAVKKQILDAARAGLHPVDRSLFEKLSVLESIPEKHVYQDAIQTFQEQKKKKRRFMLLFFLIALVALSGILTTLFNTGNTELPAANASVDEGKAGTHYAPLPDHTSRDRALSQAEDNNHQETDKTINEIKTRKHADISGKSGYFGHERSTDISIGLSEEGANTLSNAGMLSEEYAQAENHTLKMIGLQKMFPEHGVKSGDQNKLVLGLPRKKLSLFSLNIQFGYANETALTTNLKTDNVHKDAISNYRQASGNFRNGGIYSLNIGYRINRHFVFKVGLQYSSTVKNTHFNYTYSEAPVYDSMTGNITGYVSRSPVHVDESTSIRTTSYAVPVQLYAKAFELKRLSIWAGLGNDFIVQQASKGKLFSFNRGGLRNFRSISTSSFSPNASLLFQYQWKPGLAFTLNLQAAYLKNRLNFEQGIYEKREIMSTLRFGLLFTPVIPVK